MTKCLEFSCQGLKDDDQFNPPDHNYIHEQNQSIETKTESNSTTTFNKGILLNLTLFALPGLNMKRIIWPMYPNLVTNRNNTQRQGGFQTDYKKTAGLRPSEK